MALRVKAVLDADGSRFRQEMGRAERAVGTLGRRFAALFSIGAAAAWVRNSVQWISQMTDLAGQTGVAVEEMQRLDAAARKSGAAITTLAKAFQNIEYKRGQALLNPNGPAAQGFAAFGYGQDRLRDPNFSSRAFLREVGSMGTRALQQMTLPLRNIFEETGPLMIEAFSIYAGESLQGLATVSAETAKQIDGVSDSMSVLQQQMMVGFGMIFEFGGKIVDAWKAAFWGVYNVIEQGRLGNSGSPMKQFLEGFFEAMEEYRPLETNEPDKPPPGYVPPEFRKASLNKTRSLYTDSLVGSGNFLGSAGNAAETVANRLRRMTYEKLDDMNRNIEQLVKQANGGGFAP